MRHSAQIYSIRNFGDFNARLALLREAGFEWVETAGLHELEPRGIAEHLARAGVRLSSMHASLLLIESETAKLVETCRLTGCDLIILSSLPLPFRPRSAEGWRRMGERLAGHAAGLAVHGLRLAYHNHDYEFLNYEGRAALDWMFEAAGKRLGWEPDLGWLVRAGADPEAFLARHGERIVACHIKDVAPEWQAVDEDGWAAPGAGIIAWPRLLPRLRELTDLFVFEHDNPSDAKTCLKAGRTFMKSNLS